MSAKDLLLDFAEIDENRVVADLEEIRRFNPQRFEMEQLTAIVFDDFDRKICAGYKTSRRRSSGFAATCLACR